MKIKYRFLIALDCLLNSFLLEVYRHNRKAKTICENCGRPGIHRYRFDYTCKALETKP